MRLCELTSGFDCYHQDTERDKKYYFQPFEYPFHISVELEIVSCISSLVVEVFLQYLDAKSIHEEDCE